MKILSNRKFRLGLATLIGLFSLILFLVLVESPGAILLIFLNPYAIFPVVAGIEGIEGGLIFALTTFLYAYIMCILVAKMSQKKYFYLIPFLIITCIHFFIAVLILSAPL